MDILNYILNLRIDYELINKNHFFYFQMFMAFLCAIILTIYYFKSCSKKWKKYSDKIIKEYSEEVILICNNLLCLFCSSITFGAFLGIFILAPLFFKNIEQVGRFYITPNYYLFFILMITFLIIISKKEVETILAMTKNEIIIYREKFKKIKKKNEIERLKLLKNKIAITYTNGNENIFYIFNICNKNYKEIIKERFNVEEWMKIPRY